MKKYYAGIGSRETPGPAYKKMSEIAKLLEAHNFILRSGGARGADTAFEESVSDKKNMHIYLPKPMFNGHSLYDEGCIYIDEDKDIEDYRNAFESLQFHPTGFNMKLHVRNMMIRNYFQINGRISEELSSFVICWTPDAANGSSIRTSYSSGGTGQAIRLAVNNDIPVYNLKDDIYSDMSSDEIVKLILENLENNINPNIVKVISTASLF